MRFVVATVLMVLSAIGISVGFILKGPFDANSSHKVQFNLTSAYSYQVIPHSTLTAFDGQITVKATGAKQVFYANARERDIQDWIGNSNFVRLNVTPNQKNPDPTVITAGGTDANPEGSDLWRDSVKVKNELVTTVSMLDDTGVLLASDGLHRGPRQVTILWNEIGVINWPLVFIGVGLALLVAALIMNFLGFRNLRKLRGPRRKIPKAPKGPRLRKASRMDIPVRGRRRMGRTSRRMMIAPVGLITVSLLTGCAPSSPEPTSASKFEKVSVVVTDAQLQRIVRNVAATIKTSDNTRDTNLLLTRAAGPTLETRKIQYLLQVKSKKIARLNGIIASPITVSLPMQLPDVSLGWQPRTLMVVTKAASSTKAPQMLVLQQATPRDNYKLWYLVDLMPTDFPSVAAENVGALSVDPSNSYLVTPVRSLPFKYGDVLNKGSLSTYAPEFDLTADQYYAAISQLQTEQQATLKKSKVAVKFVHSLADQNILGMLTLGSGGLIAMAMNDTSVIKPQTRASAVSVTQLDQKLLLGAPGSSTGLKIVYENMLLFYVPAGSNEKIRLIGATQGLLSVKALN